jgi:hypothetical protein
VSGVEVDQPVAGVRHVTYEGRPLSAGIEVEREGTIKDAVRLPGAGGEQRVQAPAAFLHLRGLPT